MTFHTDNFYTIGASHKVCQDYSLSCLRGNRPDSSPLLVVADGCSATSDSDLGARLLVRSILANAGMLGNSAAPAEEGYRQFGAAIVATACAAARSLALPATALDTTAVVGFRHETAFCVWFYGDGALVVETTDGTRRCTTVTYDSGAPYYLSYWPDPTRRAAYLREFPGCIAVTTHLPAAATSETVRHDILHPVMFSLPLSGLKSVIIASDGLLSFVDERSRLQPDIELLLGEFLGFKSRTGEFLKRRIFRCTAQLAQKGIRHHDDLAMAACLFSTEEAS